MNAMRVAALGLLVLSLFSCASCRTGLSDADLGALRAELPGIAPDCIEKLRRGGINALPVRTDACFEMEPARLWRGLWRNDFEGSRLCPEPVRECSYDTLGERIWLSLPEDAPRRAGGYGGVYAVELLGRRTRYPGRHGHFGLSQHQLLADRIYSLREVEPPPPPLTEAESEEAFRRCEAAGNCVSMETFKKIRKRKRGPPD